MVSGHANKDVCTFLFLCTQKTLPAAYSTHLSFLPSFLPSLLSCFFSLMHIPCFFLHAHGVKIEGGGKYGMTRKYQSIVLSPSIIPVTGHSGQSSQA
jgi:hypothetical protein